MEDFENVIPFTGEPKGGDLLAKGDVLVKSEVGYHTAISVQKPRQLDAVVTAVMREAVYGGDNFYYRWPAKTKDGKTKIIEGGSIGLALAIAREWTNCAIPVEVEEKNGYWIFTAAFVDLEKGFTVIRTFKQQIPLSAPGKYDLARWQDMAFQKGQSQAIRNVIFNGVPRWLQIEAREVAKDASLKKITKEGIDTARKKAVEFLAKYGVTEAAIIQSIGKNFNEMTPDDIQTLRNFATQIQNGEVSPESLFPSVEEKGEKQQKQDKKTSEITEYYNLMKELKETFGEEAYYAILNEHKMENAASAKNKSARDRILNALQAALELKKRSEEEQPVENERMIACPNTGNPDDPETWDEMHESHCNSHCNNREGCPAWE